MAAELVDDPRLAGLALKEAWRRVRRATRAPWLPLFSGAGPDRILAVPREFHHGDMATAETIYAGCFHLAGHRIEVTARSPFERLDAPLAWQVELYGFSWLRHLSETQDALSAENARALVLDFMNLPRRRRSPASEQPEVMARRIVSFLTHCPIIMAQGDDAFRGRFLDLLASEVRYLRRIAAEVSDGMPRLGVRIALAFSALCLPAHGHQIKLATQNLSSELDRQVHADGGHASRNPELIIEILAQLLPLRQLYAQRSQPVPRVLLAAIDRMLPALRFFRHAEGSFALFNGAGAGDRGLLLALLRFDETLGEPMSHMRQSGYQRLTQNGVVVIADAGTTPQGALSRDAHAGTLAFEFSSGQRRLVVNCGAPQKTEHSWRKLARTTAAHSTLTVADQSSSRFARSGLLDRFLGSPLVSGPSRVPVSREDDAAGQSLSMAHDGYRAAFGLVHERELFLSRDGRLLEGSDRLFKASRPARKRKGEAGEANLRFHLHPDVEADPAGTGIRLSCGNEVWWFFADSPLALEDSIFFADPRGAKRTKQIVVTFGEAQAEVHWRFERRL
ncbi:heparinase [Aureimonas fodinaquatilis]|uniref:Heparinase n=1 Tax=Aureimonas fodinaquatilis TaxID=2565783 RepID=A0A5B0DR95_9HYPH|nr:heparinase II/III family protein [Aureimonas fodinaquatilis]KAA0968261.1 heparinase [Aureimonas fodinaquatilis]